MSPVLLLGWIREDNLKLFLEMASEVVGYRFDAWDWDAIRFGIRDTGRKQDIWYEYALVGTSPVHFSFAREGIDHLSLKVEAEAMILTRFEALTRITQCRFDGSMSQELENLIESAFASMSYPGDEHIMACEETHLAGCVECQEAFAFFRGKDWKELAREDASLPYHYGGPIFLTSEARRFFIPAYLITALRHSNREKLEAVLSLMPADQWEFTPLQQQLISFALRQIEEQEKFRT